MLSCFATNFRIIKCFDYYMKTNTKNEISVANNIKVNLQIKMALPAGFEGPTEYFEEFMIFLQKYEHLFNFPNTDLLLNKALDQIDVEIANVDVFQEDFDIRTINGKYLIDFFQSLNKLGVQYEKFKDKESLEFLINVPLSVKKKHEIGYLAHEIENVCNDIKCDTIVDFGSGLGYLDEQLFKTTDYNVLGLECNETNYVGAKKRQRKYYSDSVQRVKYIKHMVNAESSKNIEEYLTDKFPDSQSFCIAGLHACADLTIDAVNIFMEMEKARALIIMPCCYHRILVTNNGRFKNFPLSHTLREVYIRDSGFKYLTVPFLRLATQPPKAKAENLEDLVFNLLARAVLQVYAFKHNCNLKRNKRKAVRLKTLHNSFEAYAANAINGFKLQYNTTFENKDQTKEEKFVTEELVAIWREITETIFKKTAIFVLLQNCLQPVFENFILYDRLVYLHENGIGDCIIKKIVNEKVSPRCLALLARK